MNILLNFLPLKKGGGVQVGLDFINQARNLGRNHSWYLVATIGTPFANLQNSENFKVAKLVANSPFSRLKFECLEARNLIRSISANVVYTQFGPHFPTFGVNNVVGCAYSNLMYPELVFWQKLPWYQRVQKRMIDIYRLNKIKSADAVIFETEDLKHRAVKMHGISINNAYCVKPSVSYLVNKNSFHHETAIKCANIPAGNRILMLSGYHPNKNIELLPKIAKFIRRGKQMCDVVFVVTLPNDHPGTRRIFDVAESLGVSDCIYNLGPIPSEGCAEAYRACSAVILPSRLESFSNNIAEAWSMGKPLMISDFDWSREICGNGAIFFNYDDPESAADCLNLVLTDDVYRNNIIENGRQRLATYLSPEQRFLAYQEIIERYACL